MYVVIRRYRLDPENLDEAIDIARNKLLPRLITIPGFKAYYHVHTEHDCLLSISVFADKTGADLSNQLARETVKEWADELLPLPPEIIEGDVVTSEMVESLITPKSAVL